MHASLSLSSAFLILEPQRRYIISLKKAKKMVSESERAIKSSAIGAEEEATGGSTTPADDLQRALLAHTCMCEAGRGLVDVLRYLACMCVAVYHFGESKKPDQLVFAGDKEKLNEKHKQETKAKLKSLQARLQVHAAAIQTRVEAGGAKAFEDEAARAEVRSAIEAVKYEIKEGHEEISTLMAAVETSAAATNAEPTIPCELCNMMVGVSKFGHHLRSRHGVEGPGEARGGTGGGGGEGGGGVGARAGGEGGAGHGFGTAVTDVWRLPVKVFTNTDCALTSKPEVAPPDGTHGQLVPSLAVSVGKSPNSNGPNASKPRASRNRRMRRPMR